MDTYYYFQQISKAETDITPTRNIILEEVSVLPSPMTQSSTFIVDFYQRLSVPETNALRTRSSEMGIQFPDFSLMNAGLSESKRTGHQSHSLVDAHPQSLHKLSNQTAVCQASIMAQTSHMVKSPHEISTQASQLALPSNRYAVAFSFS